jgi:hypothetical protein
VNVAGDREGKSMKSDMRNHDKQLGLIVLATFGAVLVVEMSLLILSIWAGV